jgi:hypothetical protein
VILQVLKLNALRRNRFIKLRTGFNSPHLHQNENRGAATVPRFFFVLSMVSRLCVFYFLEQRFYLLAIKFFFLE